VRSVLDAVTLAYCCPVKLPNPCRIEDFLVNCDPLFVEEETQRRVESAQDRVIRFHVDFVDEMSPVPRVPDDGFRPPLSLERAVDGSSYGKSFAFFIVTRPHMSRPHRVNIDEKVGVLDHVCIAGRLQTSGYFVRASSK
jgi:hypothetical protein